MAALCKRGREGLRLEMLTDERLSYSTGPGCVPGLSRRVPLREHTLDRQSRTTSTRQQNIHSTVIVAYTSIQYMDDSNFVFNSIMIFLKTSFCVIKNIS